MFIVRCGPPDTFVALDAFGQDEKHAFFTGKRIAKSDSGSFRKVDGWDGYADKRFTYQNDNWARVKITEK